MTEEYRLSAIVRLEKHRAINENTGCWEWTGFKHSQGYGWVSTEKPGKPTRVHRFAYRVYLLNGGELDRKVCICHKCDNPVCFNPEHLFLGSQADNVHDRANKGRKGMIGKTCIPKKLTEGDIRAIRVSSESSTAIAPIYGINPRTVRYIRARKCWKHVL